MTSSMACAVCFTWARPDSSRVSSSRLPTSRFSRRASSATIRENSRRWPGSRRSSQSAELAPTSTVRGVRRSCDSALRSALRTRSTSVCRRAASACRRSCSARRLASVATATMTTRVNAVFWTGNRERQRRRDEHEIEDEDPRTAASAAGPRPKRAARPGPRTGRPGRKRSSGGSPRPPPREPCRAPQWPERPGSRVGGSSGVDRERRQGAHRSGGGRGDAQPPAALRAPEFLPAEVERNQELNQ